MATKKEEIKRRKDGVVTGWAKQNKMCADGQSWWKENTGSTDADLNIQKLKEAKKYEWCCWFTMKLLPPEDQVAFVIYAMDKVVSAIAPNDTDLRDAVLVAKAKNPSAILMESLAQKQVSRIHKAALMLTKVAFEYDETMCQKISHVVFSRVDETIQEDLMNYCIKLYEEE